MPAFGGDDGFMVRVCRIMSLAELFWFWGNQYTARELYNYYIHARRFRMLCVPRALICQDLCLPGNWALKI